MCNAQLRAGYECSGKGNSYCLPESCLRSVGEWAGCPHGARNAQESNRQHRTFSGPQQTFVLGSLPEQVLRQRLQSSLRVETGKALGGPGGWARESTPHFPEAGEDPTVLVPSMLPPGRGTLLDFHLKAQKPHQGQGPCAWASLKRHPCPLGGANLGSLRSLAPPQFHLLFFFNFFFFF